MPETMKSFCGMCTMSCATSTSKRAPSYAATVLVLIPSLKAFPTWYVFLAPESTPQVSLSLITLPSAPQGRRDLIPLHPICSNVTYQLSLEHTIRSFLQGLVGGDERSNFSSPITKESTRLSPLSTSSHSPQALLLLLYLSLLLLSIQ